jgi:YD repeat-containing protein
MKKALLFACALFITASIFANDINVSEKALKAFETTFTDAQNVVWTNIDNVYTAKFTQDGVATSVNYDEQGNFISSRRYYQNAKLPIDIQCKLQKQFSGKTVYGVTEIALADNVYYFVKLEDATSWTSLKINGAREIEVLDKLRKL